MRPKHVSPSDWLRLAADSGTGDPPAAARPGPDEESPMTALERTLASFQEPRREDGRGRIRPRGKSSLPVVVALAVAMLVVLALLWPLWQV